MPVPDGYVECQGDGAYGVVRADVADLPLAAWWASGEHLAGARGRGDGVEVLVPRPGLRVVARTYRRGGVLGGVLRARFLDPRRPARELEALLALRAAGVPCVEPVAALARRDGSLWQLRLLTILVEGSLPLPAFAAAHPEWRRPAVAQAGRVVAAAFAAGLRHRDLHPDNLIAVAPAGTAPPCTFLLDLDRARVAPPVSAALQVAMLTRMVRYVVRHRASLPAPATRTDGMRFLAGMGLDRARRRTTARAIATRLRRQLALRRWLGPR